MLVPAGVVFIWASTHASIPAGWQRETSLDSTYPKGTADSVNPNVTGGSATHSHTSPEHTHTIQSHTHTGRSHGADTSGGWSKDDSNANENGTQADHYHNFTSDGPTGGSLTDAITYASVNHEPPYRKVIFIKPSAGLSPLRANTIGLYGSSTVPTGWTFCNGDSGTPDLRNRYLKGAATSADADVSTDNGSLTHSHNVDHSHTDVGHTHAGTSDAATADPRGTTDGNSINLRDHKHTFTLASTTIDTGAYSGSVTSGDTEPLYKKLLAIKNTSGGNSLPTGMIGMWLGNLDVIPIGWFLCDGNGGRQDMRGYHLKIANATSEVGNTGGSNTHSHSASNSHGHSGASHQHDVPGMSQTAEYPRNTNGTGFAAIQTNHLHNQSGGRVDASATSYGNTTISGDSVNSEPPYRTVAFIQYKYSTGGLPLMALL